MNKTNKLPDKLWELLELALNDLFKAEKDDEYSIDMDIWYREPEVYSSKCKICMAGAVLAKTLKVKNKEEADSYLYGENEESKLYAINELREGELKEACISMQIKLPEGLQSRYMVGDYHENRGQWVRAMKRMIVRLKKHNI